MEIQYFHSLYYSTSQYLFSLQNVVHFGMDLQLMY
jgi:hypothetical protein